MKAFIAIIRRLYGERAGMGSELPALTILQEDLLHRMHPATVQYEVIVPDVSFYQGDIDFRTMREHSDGVIIRAGQRTWVDSRFLENWQAAKEAGLPRGSYWFYDSREAPEKQAALWWSLVKDNPGELVHAADMEESYGGPYGSTAHMKKFISEFKRLSGLPDSRIAIYSGYYWWVDRTGGDPFFSDYPLWLAQYTPELIRIPPPWVASDLLFWQFTPSGNGPAYGVSSQEIDLSYYCCSRADFYRRFGLPPFTPPPGEPMAIYKKCTATDGLNIRQGMGTSYPDLGDLFLNDYVIGSEEEGGWLHLTHAYRGGWEGEKVRLNDGQTVEARAAALNDVWAKASYLVTVAPPPVEPEPPVNTLPDVMWIGTTKDNAQEYRKTV